MIHVHISGRVTSLLVITFLSPGYLIGKMYRRSYTFIWNGRWHINVKQLYVPVLCYLDEIMFLVCRRWKTLECRRKTNSHPGQDYVELVGIPKLCVDHFYWIHGLNLTQLR